MNRAPIIVVAVGVALYGLMQLEPRDVSHREHLPVPAEVVPPSSVELGTAGTPDSSVVTVQGVGVADQSTQRIVTTRRCTGVGPTWHCVETNE